MKCESEQETRWVLCLPCGHLRAMGRGGQSALRAKTPGLLTVCCLARAGARDSLQQRPIAEASRPERGTKQKNNGQES